MMRLEKIETMNSYTSRLSRLNRLSREDELLLSERAQQGDMKARDALVNSLLTLVVSVAKRYARQGGRLDDLIQEGNIGLLKAIEHYDRGRNIRLATYAVWWIRAYMQRYVQNNRSQVHGGENQRGKDLWLDTLLDEHGAASHLERLVDDKTDQERDYMSKEHSRDVREALQRVRKRLGDLGWEILQERLTQDSPQTLEELGRRWGVSRERVRQVELKTKVLLARYLEPLVA